MMTRQHRNRVTTEIPADKLKGKERATLNGLLIIAGAILTKMYVLPNLADGYVAFTIAVGAWLMSGEYTRYRVRQAFAMVKDVGVSVMGGGDGHQ